ncbi:telomere-protecting terminal protein Tpg [Streptomyces sparsogenes]|uniref:telomere-protecting terminal protein Tpg n=1 Tax=Streptomyces sparsogenes TaxID=67365 RepID=UPI00384D7A5D
MHPAFDPESITDALDRADMDLWTRQPPRSDSARLRFLLSRHANHHTLAARLRISPAELQAALRGRRGAPSEQLHYAITREVARLWQPLIRRWAHHSLAERGGMMVHFRGWFGFTGAAGSSDDGRFRLLTEQLPTLYISRLFRAREQEADEETLRRIVADAVGEAYFRVSPTRGLRMVELKDIDYIEFSY